MPWQISVYALLQGGVEDLPSTGGIVEQLGSQHHQGSHGFAEGFEGDAMEFTVDSQELVEVGIPQVGRSAVTG